jgi:gliding motility-associated-like protein
MDVEANQNFTNEPASYCYPDSGSFDVHIYAVSNEGCRKDSLTENYINVYSTPEPEISINSHLKNIYDPIFEFTSLTEYADSVLWSLGNGASSNQEMFSYNYVDTGTFDITLVGWNVFGCIDSTFDQVRIEPIYSMFIPTAFTPNDDGVNDTWLPVSYAVNEYELLIYDRWGENIFTSDDPYEAWNGRKKGTGQIAQVDVYVYKIVLVDDLGEEHKYVGRISLVK